ncbi:histone-fold-containing protein [Eremomyces bilateralis CBS 781.70]|uniref:DNA polymerase epsilon subunit D n=1 Tax=Eremomyces bilateralis CBS 781.70 TaxID=1392243 RepID=A0A6G1GFV8_9PEZI|nr:histone-fold-containing protein [Eremomyces bilateralis CBS 781.70]KAF1816958.1 histone-fold-containing protein [Eremomyces bilateralis CBS 781.70]
MPARKSNASVSADNDATNNLSPAELAAKQQEMEGLSVEDLSLPKTMIQRLSKGVLPPNTQIQKDALLAISKSATVFVNYLAAYAYDTAERSNHRVIQGPDVLAALNELEFHPFMARVEREMQKYQEIQCDKRNNYRKHRKEAEKAKKDEGGGEATEGAESGVRREEAERPAKKEGEGEGEELEHDEVEEEEEEEEEQGETTMDGEDLVEEMEKGKEEDDDVLDDGDDSDAI